MSITVKEYFALAGSTFTNDDARVIGPVLQEIAADGDVTAEAVVQAAHSANSPLRGYFEWDDKRAAHQYRVGQARDMIQSVRVRFVSQGKEYATRAYHVAVSKEHNSLPREFDTSSVIPHPLETLLTALREIDAWRLKYVHLQSMKRVNEVIGPLLSQIEEFREDFAAAKNPVDLQDALAQLTEWQKTIAPSVPPTALAGEHVGYMVEAIDAAWDAYAKIKGDRFARDKAIERENEELQERVKYLESLLASEDMMPSEFGLTRTEERVLSILLERDSVSKEQILQSLYSERPNEIPEIKIVDVFICKIRPKIEPFGIKIDTLWGRGYSMPLESKAELRGMIAARKTAAA